MGLAKINVADVVNENQLFYIANNDLTQKKGLTLTAIMHNEMYFLPEFLEHYRKLGVQRFILLDDASTDGSVEFVSVQPDVMLLQSDYRFGDKVFYKGSGKEERAMLSWRQGMLETFCQNQWSLHLDLDEFVYLPKDQGFHGLINKINSTKIDMVWGAMIDLYPEKWDHISNSTHKINDINWYFDGVQHLKPSRFHSPPMLYSGSRSRLCQSFGISQSYEKRYKKILRKILGNPYPRMGIQRKPILLNWNRNLVFKSCHRIKHAKHNAMILPIAHYKYTPNFVDRVEFSVSTGAHHNGSKGYIELRNLRDEMIRSHQNFLCDSSVKFEGFESFVKTRNAIGI